MARVIKSLPANAGDLRDAGSIPGLGRSPGEGHSKAIILAWRIPWRLTGYNPWGHKESGMTE